MCRFLAYLGPPVPLSSLVFDPTHSLLIQSHAPRRMLAGSVNADGYGVAWYADGGPVRVAGNRPLWRERDLPALLRSVRSSCVLAAVRNTSPGIVAGESGLQPVVRGGHGFVLNGFVEDFRRSVMRRMHAALSDRRYAELEGTSDTEAVFLLALDALERGASRSEALREACERTLAEAGRAGVEAMLTAALTDGGGVSALRLGNRQRANSLFVNRDYAGGAALASEPLDEDAGWLEVEPGGVVELR
ncbi:MAG: class II glutamine amidotransferase [Longimicrobiaceae bacterium]